MFNMNHFIEEDLRKQKDKGINSFLVKEHPKDLLEKAYKKIVSNSEVDAGSTTACIVSMAPSDDRTELNPVIRGANLGDSGFLVIRNGKGNYLFPLFPSLLLLVETNLPISLPSLPIMILQRSSAVKNSNNQVTSMHHSSWQSFLLD
jgi:hypothetical protein